MGVKLLQLASTPEQQPKVCSWEWDSHQCWTKFPVCTSHCYFIYCSWPSLQPVSCIKIQMWKTLPASSLNYFFLLLLFGGKTGAFFFFSSPSTSFLLWNVSNGQRLASDWLNSKTISFVLMLLFENSYQFAQGKKRGCDLSCTRWGCGLRSSDAALFSGKKQKGGKGALAPRAAGCPTVLWELRCGGS